MRPARGRGVGKRRTTQVRRKAGGFAAKKGGWLSSSQSVIFRPLYSVECEIGRDTEPEHNQVEVGGFV